MDTNNTMNGRTVTTGKTKGVGSVRYIAVTAMLSAVAFILMFCDFPIPFLIPDFIEMDVSELPALIGAFAMGPMCGVLVCLVKNLLHLMITSTGGVGELSNFLLGASFVLTAGLVYKHKKSRKNAVIGAVLGAAVMAAFSVVSNYFLTYPVYYNFMSEDMVLALYRAILPSVENILQCLIIFNMPFTFVKGLLSAGITFLIYKHISPILKGTTLFR